jgi:ATP-binding cassette subfamily B protein
MRLSGGQAQRVAIARAVSRRPSLLILDEATSSLDAESERAVHQGIDELLHGRTAFVIAHRLSTVRDADRIVVLDRGRIVEQGTHDDLVSRRSLYWYLAGQQLDG